MTILLSLFYHLFSFVGFSIQQYIFGFTDDEIKYEYEDKYKYKYKYKYEVQ
jgi:hypothetical protein